MILNMSGKYIVNWDANRDDDCGCGGIHSPLNYLVLIEAVEVLQQPYQRIFVPEAVITELRSSDAPLQVQQWAASLPKWVAVRAVADELLTEPRWQAAQE
jgi:predicted nucleic acid-binding protein